VRFATQPCDWSANNGEFLKSRATSYFEPKWSVLVVKLRRGLGVWRVRRFLAYSATWPAVELACAFRPLWPLHCDHRASRCAVVPRSSGL